MLLTVKIFDTEIKFESQKSFIFNDEINVSFSKTLCDINSLNLKKNFGTTINYNINI